MRVIEPSKPQWPLSVRDVCTLKIPNALNGSPEDFLDSTVVVSARYAAFRSSTELRVVQYSSLHDARNLRSFLLEMDVSFSDLAWGANTKAKLESQTQLHAQLAQLSANLSDTENLLRMTSVQAECMRGLGSYHGAL